MILSITGHRQERIEDEKQVRAKINETFSLLKPELVIQGMSRGVDAWSAAEAWACNIPYIAALPWVTHKAVPQHIYDWLIRNAQRVEVVHESNKYPGPWVFFKRNEWMVDNSDTVLAVWDGEPNGGTYGTIQYAIKQGKKLYVISPDGKELIEYN